MLETPDVIEAREWLGAFGVAAPTRRLILAEINRAEKAIPYCWDYVPATVTGYGNHVIPRWTRGREIWCEDECTRSDPNAERIADAWLRKFGEPMPVPKRGARRV